MVCFPQKQQRGRSLQIFGNRGAPVDQLVGGNRRQISASRAASCGSCHKRTSCDHAATSIGGRDITLENFLFPAQKSLGGGTKAVGRDLTTPAWPAPRLDLMGFLELLRIPPERG